MKKVDFNAFCRGVFFTCAGWFAISFAYGNFDAGDLGFLFGVGLCLINAWFNSEIQD